MRVCIVYDCLFPWTKGGAERWYRVLADELVRNGHQVTYLTRRQWDADDVPDLPGVRVVPVSAGGELYDREGSRRIGPAVAFTRGVVAHLARHRSAYDVVHVCQVPVMIVPAVRVVLLGSGVVMGVDWHEVWSAHYWRQYLGGPKGAVAALVQRVAAWTSPLAFPVSKHTERKLVRHGLRGEVHVMPGLVYESLTTEPTLTAPAHPQVVYVGRHIPDKRVNTVPAAVAAVRRTLPELTATVLGDGPARPAVLAEIERLGLQEVVRAPGFVSHDEMDTAVRAATCLLFPSGREGYGLVVVEAAARGTPSVVVAGPDNSAAELVEDGVNGVVTTSADPEVLAAAVVRIHESGPPLRESTARWFADGVDTRSVQASARMILGVYEERIRRTGRPGWRRWLQGRTGAGR